MSHSAAYDSARGRTVVFGGLEMGSLQLLRVGDTWEHDGAAWTENPSPGPSPRSGHALAYDSGRGKVVLFGGDNVSHTWEYDGTSWMQQQPANAPFTRSGHALAYDSARGRVTAALLGARFYNQFLVVDPPANLLGLVATNGGAAVIGNL